MLTIAGQLRASHVRVCLIVPKDIYPDAIARLCAPWDVERPEAFDAVQSLAERAVYNMALLHVQSLYRA